MTDKSRDLGDWQTAVDAYVAAGYSREGAEAVLDQHCAIVASHKPPGPPPMAVADPDPIIEAEDAPAQAEPTDITELPTSGAIPDPATESHQQPSVGQGGAL